MNRNFKMLQLLFFVRVVFLVHKGGGGGYMTKTFPFSSG